ncbi:A-kinase anchor protein 200 [Epinephelus moara]|uniref:A-kinase anchor protein 200 n=1 Tax=Epinephelus moara TaxID=300413 RepID=UPI00214E4AD9|nr:A-kinase anchor protein 200 [Epinephelus moara]XP_049896607.1 A-kinase anchor protein 200 [Epinephelus moara]
MSKDVNRYKVFQTTRVRKALKNDGCWIHKSKEEEEEQDKARTDPDVETKPASVRQNSYVLSTAKKFESLDSPMSPPFQKLQFAPSEGNSSNQANGEVIPPQKDAQPEGSTVETTDDAKPQAPKEELIQNGGTQPEKSDANTTVENNQEHAAVDPANVEHNDGAAKVSAEVHVAECIQNGDAQPGSSTSPETVSPVEPVEQPVTKTTADVPVEDPVAEPCAAAVTEENKATAEVPVVPAVELKPQEEPSTKTESVGLYITHLKDTGVESVQPAEVSCEKCPPEQAGEKIVEAVAEVVVKSSPDTADVVSATPGKEPALQNGVDAVAEVAVAPANPAVAHASGEEAAPQASAEAVAEVVVKSSPDTSDEVSATPGKEAAAPLNSGEAVAEVAMVPETPDVTHTAGEEAAPENGVEAVTEVVLKSSPDTCTEINATPGEEAAAPPNSGEAVAEVTVESSPETPVGGAAGEEPMYEVILEPVPDFAGEPVSKLPSQSATKTATEGTCEKGPPQQTAQETVEAVGDVAVKSSPETPAVTGATEEEAALQVSVNPVPDLVADTTKPAAETAVKSVDCEVEPAAPAEPVFQTRTEEVVECEVQPVDNTVVEQSVEPTPESAADHVGELDAVKPVTDAEAVPDKFSDRPIELSEALNGELPKTEAAPLPLKDPDQSHTEETKLNQHSDGTNTSEMFQKPRTMLQYSPSLFKTRCTKVCSICLKTFDGNIKLHLSDPAVTCHPECLKCGVCNRVLGDLLTPMFLHGQVVKCGTCFAAALSA